MNRLRVPHATTLVLCFLTILILAIANSAAQAAAYRLPQFRVPQGAGATLPPDTALRLVADENFAPFSFRAANGVAAGLAVDLARSACAEIKVSCKIDLLPFDEVSLALGRADADIVLDGPQLTAANTGSRLLTRPWFRSFGRFAVQAGSPLEDASPARLAGKRIAVQKNSAHALWLARYYGKAAIVEFDTVAAAAEALRSGAADVMFGDNLAVIYWVSGAAARQCCKLLDGPFTEFGTISRNYSFAVRGERDDVRQAFDSALDRLQQSGATEKLFNAYVPLSPW